jgi:hypothetical protein
MKLDLAVREEEGIAIVKESHKSLNKILPGKIET